MLAFLFQIKSVEDIIFVAFFSGLTFWQYKSYFKFAAPTFKIHWIRRGNSKLKGIALEFKEKVIKYGSSDDEVLFSTMFIIPYSDWSERFQFEDFSFDVKVTSIKEVDVHSHVYITVAKDAEFEELLSRENVKQFAAQINKPNNTLGITRADFVESYNAAL